MFSNGKNNNKMIYSFNEIYSIEIYDSNTVEIKLKWGPQLKWTMSTFLHITESGEINWIKYNNQFFPIHVMNFFNKIVKNKAFL